MSLKDRFKQGWREAKRARARGEVRGDVRRRRTSARKAVSDPVTHGPSPNPATNLVLADIAMRSGGELLRMGVETALLGRRYGDRKAKKAAKGRTIGQTLVGAALSRLATRSVPGALLVGGGLLAKTLYDRAQGPGAARAAGEKDIAEQAKKGE